MAKKKGTAIVDRDGEVRWSRSAALIERMLASGVAVRIDAHRIAMIGAEDRIWRARPSGGVAVMQMVRR